MGNVMREDRTATPVLDPAADPESLLTQAGLRVAAPRKVVLAVVHEDPHTDTEIAIRAARERLPTFSRRAPYDALRTLTYLFYRGRSPTSTAA